MEILILDIMSLISKNIPSFIAFIITIVAAGFAFYSAAKDNEQKNNIEKLSKETKELSQLNKSISENVKNITEESKNIVRENLKLSKENIDLAEKSRLLISEVQKLTQKSKEVIVEVNKVTSYAAEENLKSGKLNIRSGEILSDNDFIRVKMGGIDIGNKIKNIKGGHKFIVIGGTDYIVTKFDENNNPLISLKVIDIQNNLMAEIKDNYWRANLNFTSMINYDEKGFEMIDNFGNVSLSIDVLENNTIFIQGMFVLGNKIYFNGSNTSLVRAFPINLTEVNKVSKEAGIFPLFEYAGENWLHKRRHK